ncbi:MAG: ATP-binding protein, partial [Actinomycetota bacterium]|nr:ATP-binding protein [Actinomycetota bacterium]
RLRTRSLRLVGYWAVLFGLTLDLTDRYAGAGVIHAWVLRGGMLTGVPVLMLLVHWWRRAIFEGLEEHAEASGLAAKLLARRTGIGSYTAAAFASLFLTREAVIRVIVRTLSGYELGRRVIAQLVRREVARDGEREGRTGEEPIADEIILPLIAARDVCIDEIAKTELDLMMASIAAHGGGARAVIGERGAGKTIFLERLAERFDGAMRVVDCPVGGYDELEKAIADVFEVQPGDGFAGRLQAALEKAGVRAIGIDDFHRLPRPWLGGQAGLARLAALAADVESEISWIFALDKHAWRYVLLAGGERALLHDMIELPAWTEEQIAALVDARADAIDLVPDYEKLVLPRQLDTGDYEDDEQRNRFGYARILWELADGNPEVSLYLFAESMRRLPDGSVILRLPQLSSPGSLVNAHPDALLVLRVLVQCDVASAEDVARSLQLPISRVEQILRFCTQNGWVTFEHGGHRVSWRWFRSVTRALVRQNLMTR